VIFNPLLQAAMATTRRSKTPETVFIGVTPVASAPANQIPALARGTGLLCQEPTTMLCAVCIFCLEIASRRRYGSTMVRKASSRGYRPALPGIERKTLVYGDRTLLTEFRMCKGSALPRHAHPAEQTGYLVSGHLRLTIGRRTVDARPGDSWSIPGHIEHGAAILEDSVAIEVFSPVRKDYLPRRRVIGPPSQVVSIEG
jgi:quercetin dioxygenase-like cupin family protein